MYVHGEALQWYDPALLFPSCPLGSDGVDDLEHSFGGTSGHQAALSFSSYRSAHGHGQGGSSVSPSAVGEYGAETSGASASSADVRQRVQQRARELLVERLSEATLTSSADAAGSVSTLLRSLHTGMYTSEPTPSAATATAAAHRSSLSSGKRSGYADSNPLTAGRRRGGGASLPAALSSGATQTQASSSSSAASLLPFQRERRGSGRRGPLSYMDIFATDGAGDGFEELMNSDSDAAAAHAECREDGRTSAEARTSWNNSVGGGGGYDSAADGGVAGHRDEDDEDDDGLALGGWPSTQGGAATGRRGAGGASDAATAAHQARRLREYFGVVPPQLGVQEEPVLCPLNLQTDPLAHVVAAAEVFAVVTTTVPQVLCVFDQLNNIPISSSVLGGTTYAANVSGEAHVHADGGRSDGGAAAATAITTPAASSSSFSAAPSSYPSVVRTVACTISRDDVVRHLWMDPTGTYCVLVFASGKAVYYHIPRRTPPSSATAGFHAAAASAARRKKATAGTADGRAEGGSDGSDSSSGDHESDSDGEAAQAEKKRQRRQEKHREWKAAARRWLRLSRRRTSAAGEDDGDGSDADGAAAGGAGGKGGIGDAACQPRGFSLSFDFGAAPGETAEAAARNASTRRPARRFVPSCVGWCQQLPSSGVDDHAARHGAVSRGGPAVTVGSRTASPGASSPRGILKSGIRASPQRRPKQRGGHDAVSPWSTATAEALLGAQSGGAIIACVLTPSGATNTRLVFCFPAPVAAAASVDSIAVLRAPAAQSYTANSRDSASASAEAAAEAEEERERTADGQRGGGDGAGVSGVRHLAGTTVSGGRRVRWQQEDSVMEGGGRNAGLGGGPSAFPRYAHTPHFRPADEARDGDGGYDGASPASPPATDSRFYANAAPLKRASGASWSHLDSSPPCRWVVLVAVRNRLYVFATPSSTMDFTELEENMKPFSTLGDSSSSALTPPADHAATVAVTRPVLMPRQWTSQVEDAFALYHAAPTTLSSRNPSIVAQVQPALSSPPADGAAAAAAAAAVAVAPRALTNYIVVEPTSLTAHSANGYPFGPSQVHASCPAGLATATPKPAAHSTADGSGDGRTPPAASTASKRRATKKPSATTSAPFLVESTTRAEVSLVLPSPPPPSSSYASGSSFPGPSSTRSPPTVPTAESRASFVPAGGLVAPAALPPAFYWRYGDVLVHGVLLCGAGGLEVGAKVRTLVHQDLLSEQDTSAASAAAVVYGKNAPSTGSTRLDTAVPSEFTAATASRAATTAAGAARGLETGLAELVDAALAETQDLNVFASAMGTDTHASRSRGEEGDDGSGVSPLPALELPAAQEARVPAADGSGKGLEQRRAQLSAVLPIGLLSVVNVNSCLQSLRGLLGTLAAARGARGRQAGPRPASHRRVVTFAHCDVDALGVSARASLASRSGVSASMAVAAATSDTPLAPLSHGSVDLVHAAGNRRDGTLCCRCSQADALRHPLLLFPWSSRLELRDSSTLKDGARAASGARGGVSSSSSSRYRKHHSRHRHGRSHHHRPHSSPQSPPFSPTGQASGHTIDTEATNARRGVHGGECVAVPLLSASLARGDVDADTVRRLRATARAFLRRSPLLFDTPVEAVLRATAQALSVAEEHDGAAIAATAADGSGGDCGCGGKASSRTPTQAAPSIQLEEHGEVLVSFAAHYTHLVFTTTQGVYVLAHAAVLPVTEDALSWRQRLVYHAITARPRAASSPAASPSVGVAGPLFTAVADATAPEMFYLASRSRMLRLQVPSLRSSAAGRWQLAVQLLAAAQEAAAAAQTPPAGAAVPPVTALQPDASSLLLSALAGTAAHGGGGRPHHESGSAASARGVPAAVVADARHRATTIARVVVPSTLAYEVRLRGVLRPEHGPMDPTAEPALGPDRDAMAADRGGSDGGGVEEEDEELYATQHPLHHQGYGHLRYPRSSATRSVRSDLDGVGDRASSSSAASSQQRQQQSRSSSVQPLASPATSQPPASAFYAHSDVQSVAPSTAAVVSSPTTFVPRFHDNHAGTTRRHHHHDGDDDSMPLPRYGTAEPAAAVVVDAAGEREGSAHSPLRTAQHFLRHANRRALLLPRHPSSSSLVNNDSFGSVGGGVRGVEAEAGPLPLSSPRPHQQQHQHSTSVHVRSATASSSAGVGSAAALVPPSTGPHAGHPTALFSSRDTARLHNWSPTSATHGTPPTSGGAYSPSFPTFTQYTSPVAQDVAFPTSAAATAHENSRRNTTLASPHVSAGTPRSASAGARATAAAAPASSLSAIGAASRAEDRDLIAFLSDNPLLHYLLQHCCQPRVPQAERETAMASSGREAAPPADAAKPTRALNIPGFGLLPGSVGLTPLGVVRSRAVASVLLHTAPGGHYYCADHLYEMALAAFDSAATVVHTTASAATEPVAAAAGTGALRPQQQQQQSRRCTMLRDDKTHLECVRHAYGTFLLTHQRFLEAAVQLGKAAGGPSPLPTTLVELVRAFRHSSTLEPLIVFMLLRLRACEESSQGLGGHSIEVSMLATWLLSLLLEQCSLARAQTQSGAPRTTPVSPTGLMTAGVEGDATDKTRQGTRSKGEKEALLQGKAAAAPDFTRVAWIRRRYHLDSPAALLEDTLLRYGRFVDAAVLSAALANLASAKESVLVSELLGRPDRTVLSLVLREQKYLAGMLRLQALLADPTSQSVTTRQLLQSLVRHQEEEEEEKDSGAALHSRGTLPLTTVFYGKRAGHDDADTAGSAVRSAAPVPPSTLASLVARLSTLLLSCYPCRFVQDGLRALLHQRPDVPLPPRRLLPSLLTYTVASNESVWEATELPAVVLRALRYARDAQRRQGKDVYTLVIKQRHTASRGRGKREDQQQPKAADEAVPGATVVEGETGNPDPRVCQQTGVHVGLHAKDVSGGTAQSLSRRESKATPAGAAMQDTQLPLSFTAADAAVSADGPADAPASASPSSSLSISLNVSQHETRVYGNPNASARSATTTAGAAAAAVSSSVAAPVAFDDVLLDDSASSGSVDGDITLPPLAPAQSASTASTLEETSDRSSSSSSSPSSSPATATPSSPPRDGEASPSLFSAAALGAEGAALLTQSSSSLSFAFSLGSSESTSDSSSRTHSDTYISNEEDEEEDDDDDEVVAHPDSDAFLADGDWAALAEAHAVGADGAPLPSSSYAPSERGGGGASARAEGEGRAKARAERARQRRAAAAVQLRRALTPPLTPAAVAAAQDGPLLRSQRGGTGPAAPHAATTGGDGDGGSADAADALLPVPYHAVLVYLEDVVAQQRGAQGISFHDVDVAVFVSYVNLLARDGAEEALQLLTEQVALQHTKTVDALWAAAASRTPPTPPPFVSPSATLPPLLAASDAAAAAGVGVADIAVQTAGATYRLLHLLRLCLTHRCWAGCAWMYYALGHHREAIQTALRRVVGEEGVRLAVRLLQLLHERDRDRRHRGGDGGGGGGGGNGAAASPSPSAVGRSSAGVGTGGSSNVGSNRSWNTDGALHHHNSRASRRELWTLVARHLIQGGGRAKHGAQTALQLSLRGGDAAFDVTDVLPELPDSLFMAELKEELLSSVRELSRTMQRLRGSTAALGRDTRVLHRELQAMAHHPLTMQVDERCVLCGQPALARPFTVYLRCRHLIHTACYHHARQAMLRRQRQLIDQQQQQQPPHETGAAASPSWARTGANLSSPDSALREGHGGRQAGALTAADAQRDRERLRDGSTDAVECLLCSRRYLHEMLTAPLSAALVGDDAAASSRRIVLR